MSHVDSNLQATEKPEQPAKGRPATAVAAKKTAREPARKENESSNEEDEEEPEDGEEQEKEAEEGDTEAQPTENEDEEAGEEENANEEEPDEPDEPDEIAEGSTSKGKGRSKKTQAEREAEARAADEEVANALREIEAIELTDAQSAKFEATKKAEQEALFGYTYSDFYSPLGPELDFGTWNPRRLEESKARMLAASFRPEPRRLSDDSMIKIPVTIDMEITAEQAEELRQWRSIPDLQVKRFATPGWKTLRDVLRRECMSVTPVGGQHRRRAEELLCESYEKELKRDAQRVLGLQSEVKALAADITKAKTLGERDAGRSETLQKLKEELAATQKWIGTMKAVLSEKGKWLIALYDASE